jgi:hypothetical protein
VRACVKAEKNKSASNGGGGGGHLLGHVS